MEETKKEYGGCLSILLPLWIIGQVFSMIINFTLFGFYTDNPSIPILLIGINIVALIGIILLLQFKRGGFFIFIFAYIFSIILGFACPDAIDKNETIKTIIGMCLFLILMGIKNKETKKNGYQTLEIFSKQCESNHDALIIDKKECIKDDTTNIDKRNPQTDSIIKSNCEDFGQESYTKAPKNENISNIHNSFETRNNVIHFVTNQTIVEKKKQAYRKTLKYTIFVTIAILIGIVFIFMHDWRSDEEIYQEGKKHIEKKQYEKGINELEKIQDNYIPAKALLGELYTLNDSVKRNFQRGEKLLWEAYEANDSDACKNLTQICIDKGDWEKAKIVTEKAIGLGLWKGNRALAWLYYVDEIGGAKNSHKDYRKVEFYSLKIANKDSWCCSFLGDIFSEGGFGVEQDYSKAFYWWNKGGELGGPMSSNCISNLGWLYHNGFGVKQNYKKAYESYNKAIKIDNNNSYPYYQLSIMFRNGQYVIPNKDSVKYYLQKAAELGDENATVELENDF